MNCLSQNAQRELMCRWRTRQRECLELLEELQVVFEADAEEAAASELDTAAVHYP